MSSSEASRLSKMTSSELLEYSQCVNRIHMEVLRREIEQKREDAKMQGVGRCPICYGVLTSENTACVMPCMHACLCVSCANSSGNPIKQCPLCRGSVEKIAKLFFSPNQS
jgi:hypothetical protein